jgi:ABC-type transport system involved in cytochrome c biogenesis permease subunit
MSWAWHDYLGPLSVVLWLLGAVLALTGRKRPAVVLIASGTAVSAVFIVGLWLFLGRPPLRTMGETRLWYAFFLSTAGLVAYGRWSYSWLLVFVSVVAGVFTVINVLRPEIHSKALMPALQSMYFVPHVVLYMLSYALLAASAVAALVRLAGRGQDKQAGLDGFIRQTVRAGLGLISLGLIIGAVWAKQAWGHYWSWDPKETWAFVTLATFALYLHIDRDGRISGRRSALIILPLGFLFLMITWLGITYLPTAPGSIHVY